MPTNISPLPPAPTRENAATFSDDADAFLTALVTFRNELSSFGTDINNLTYKSSCRVATTTNITLTGTFSIDTINILPGDRVLVKAQSNSAQNGVYVVASGVWTRADDFDTSSKAAASFVGIREGNLNAGKIFYTTFRSIDTLGTTSMNWFGTTSLTLQSGTIPISGTMEPVTTATTLAAARAALGIGQLSTNDNDYLVVNSPIQINEGTKYGIYVIGSENPLSSSVTINPKRGSIQTWTLFGSTNTPTFLPWVGGDMILVAINNSAGGSVLWPSQGTTITWVTEAPVLSTTATTFIMFWYIDKLYAAKVGDI